MDLYKESITLTIFHIQFIKKVLLLLLCLSQCSTLTVTKMCAGKTKVRKKQTLQKKVMLITHITFS